MEFRIDFPLMVSRLFPVNKREPKHLAYIQSAIKQMNLLNNALFLVFFVDIQRDARRNAQRLSFESVLNEVLNPLGGAQIRIQNNSVDFEPLYFHTEAENYFFKNYFGSIAAGGVDDEPVYFDSRTVLETVAGFTVWVPAQVYDTTPIEKIESEINRFRVAGTTFQIIRY